MIRLYIASAYTRFENPLDAIYASVDIAENIVTYFGETMFDITLPLLTHFWHDRYFHTYDFWMNQCRNVLYNGNIDILYRIKNGTSKGADEEEEIAKSLKIPIVYSINELENLLKR